MTEWLIPFVGEAIAPYAAIAIALIIIFLLIAILFRILKAFSTGKFGTIHQNRLGIVEGMSLEGKRRIVLIRRDNVEHLILIGGENDVVIEQGIQHTASQNTVTKRVPQPKTVEKVNPQPKTTQQPAQQHPVNPASQPAQPKLQTSVHTRPSASATPQAPTSAMPQVPASATVQTALNPGKPAQSAPTSNDSAKVKEMNRLLDQIAGD